MELQDKLYLITGASIDSDIGRVICQKLDEQGARLILVGRRKDKLEETKSLLAHPHHYISPFDLSNLDAISNWVKELTSNLGPIDGLVHSASFQGYSPIKLISPSLIHKYFDVNFSSALLLTTAFSKPKRFTPNASFVHISSVAQERGMKGRTLYAASKAALISMVKSTAVELASKSIRINAIAPGIVSGAKAELQFKSVGEVQAAQLKALHPMGLSSPEDVANSVLFLLSSMSRNTTGTTITVDGGYLAQ